MISRKALLICIMIISAPSIVFSQKTESGADLLSAASKIINSSELSPQEKTDSLGVIITYPGNYNSFNEEEFDTYVNIIAEKISMALSPQTKFYWAKYLGRFLDVNKKIGEANLYYQIALNAAKAYNNTDGVIHIRFWLIYMYFGSDLYETAMNQVYENLEYARNLNDPAALDKVYSQIGYVVTSIAYVNRDTSLQDSALKYLAYTFENMKPDHKDYGEKAIQYCFALARSNQRQKVIDLCTPLVNGVFFPPDISYFRLSGQLMINYAILGVRDSSLHYLEKFIDGADQFYTLRNFENLVTTDRNKQLTVGCIIEICHTLLQNKMYDELLSWVELTKKAEVEFLEYETEQLDKVLASAYYAMGNYEDAAHYYKLIYERNNEATKSELRDIQLKTSSFAKTEIELQQKLYDEFRQQQKRIFQEEKKAKRILLLSFTVGSIGLMFFLLLLYRRFRKSQQQKAIIEEQKQKVDEAYDELEEKNNEILDSISYAKRIQSAILPPDKLVKEYLQESFILYKPKDIVAGDFYWMEPFQGENQNESGILFAAADCTGHGVPGAMVSVVCNNGLNRAVREYGLTDPGQILDKTREIVISEFEKSEEDVKDGMDIALCSLKGNKLKYAGAHNPLWIIRKGTEEVEEIKAKFSAGTKVEAIGEYVFIEVKADKQPIGKYDEPLPYTTHALELHEGDSFYIFSDGYADQFGGEKGKKLKAANFKRLLLSIQNETMERQHELIDNAFENWKGKYEQLDDVCVIGVRV